MRKLFFLVLFLSFLLIGGIAKEDDSRLIRRLYLDTLGLVPTTEEIEWYVVYNDNGYQIALNYILGHPKNKLKNIPLDEMIKLFNSKEYKERKRCYLTKEEIANNLFYISGCDKSYDVNCAKRKIVSDALKHDTETDIIDYMANLLMSRSTNLIEANQLLKVYRQYESLPDDQRWFRVLEEILTLEDVKSK